MNTSDNDLNTKILNWINEQGYPLELRTSRHFLRKGFRTQVSRPFEDPDTGKIREIDVTAIYDIRITDTVNLQLVYLIECKSDKEKPWIVFTDLSNKEQEGLAFLPPFGGYYTDNFRGFLHNSLKSETSNKASENMSRYLKIPHIYSPLAGHSVTQAFTSGVDIPYKAVMSCTKAAEYNIALRTKYNESRPYDSLQIQSIIYPTVIISAPLFVAYIDMNDEISINQAIPSPIRAS